MLLESAQHLVARQYLRDTGVGLAPFANCGKELAVLEFDAIHGDRHLRDVDQAAYSLPFAAIILTDQRYLQAGGRSGQQVR